MPATSARHWLGCHDSQSSSAQAILQEHCYNSIGQGLWNAGCMPGLMGCQHLHSAVLFKVLLHHTVRI
jgi:hypothetical protein